jgi:Peptidyl-tRNA hydrolase
MVLVVVVEAAPLWFFLPLFLSRTIPHSSPALASDTSLDATMTIAKPPLSRLLVPPYPKSIQLTCPQICGLGNPGRKYSHTRHSLGHLILEALRSQWHYPAWRHDVKAHGFWSGEGEKCVLFKPDVMMNSSGKAVSAAFRKMGLRETGRVVVIHDDLELPVGGVKLRKKGGQGKYDPTNPLLSDC